MVADDSNEYCKATIEEDGWAKVNTDDDFYGYKWNSKNDRIHIQEAVDYSGGSQAFGSELWVKFETWQSS